MYDDPRDGDGCWTILFIALAFAICGSVAVVGWLVLSV